MEPRGVAMRTVAAVLGIRRGPAATAGPRPRGGHGLARRCVAAVLGVRLASAAGPVAKSSPSLRMVHGSTVLDPFDHSGPSDSPVSVSAPLEPLESAPSRRVNARPIWILAASCAAVVLATTLAVFHPASGSGGTTGPASPGQLFHLLPPDIQRAGKITVGSSDTDVAPMVFTSDGTLTGLDTDILSALGARLGIAVNYRTESRTSLLADVVAGRFDLAAAGFSDTPPRRQRVDFVDYFTAWSVVTVAAPNPHDIRSVTDLCGTRVAVVSGGTDAAAVAAQNCTAGGQIHVVSVSTPANALDAVRAGAADAAVTDFPSAELAVRQSESSLEFVGEQIAPGPYGFAVGKHDRALSQALKTALDALIKDGTYGRLLAKYHLTSGAVSAARINGGQ